MTKEFFGAESPTPGSKQIDLSGYYILRFPESIDLSLVMEAYKKDPNVISVEPDAIYPLCETPNDPYFTQQWGLQQVNDHDVDAPEAWDYCQGDTSVILAIIDSGVDWQHPDLGGSPPDYTDGNIWINWIEYNGTPGEDDDGNGRVDDIRGWDFVDLPELPPEQRITGEDYENPDNDPRDFAGHGTHCAGIASAITDNGTGVAGLGWKCKNMPLRAGFAYLDTLGHEKHVVEMSFCAQAIYYATYKDAIAINCSWGSGNEGGLGAAVTYAIQHGVVVCVSAGNGNTSSQEKNYLSTRGDCIDVAATDQNDEKASFSNYGSWVDVSAPGVDILSTFYDHTADTSTYGNSSGTSMAAPFVTGLVGLVKSRYPNWSGEHIKNHIMNTTDNIDVINPGYAGQLGTGRINAHKAVFYGTIVGGNITTNTTWTKDKSPYLVTSDITVRGSTHPTLTIEPGVVVKFASGTGLRISTTSSPYYGGLSAIGTETDSIIFTSLSGNAGGWKGIVFDRYTQPSSMSHCIIENSGQANLYSVGANVYCGTTSNLTISHSNIHNSGNYGIYLDHSSPGIYSSQIINNGQYGVYCGTSSHPTLGNVVGASNDLFGNGTYDVYVGGADDVNARYNYWGTIDPDIIAARIYDKADNPERGEVFYLPWTDSTHTRIIPDTTTNLPPSTPQALLPENDSEIDSVGFLVWIASVDPDPVDSVSYILQVDDDSTFASPEISDSSVAGFSKDGVSEMPRLNGLPVSIPTPVKGKGSESPNGSLKGQKTDCSGDNSAYVVLNELSGYGNLVDNIYYYWRVKAKDNRGLESDWCPGTHWFFFNKFNNPPNPPVEGFSPADSEEIIDLTPGISWHPATDPDLSDNSSTLSYIAQLDNDGEFVEDYQYQYTTDPGLNTFVVPDTLSDNDHWFYRVQTMDDQRATSNWSAIQDFWTNSQNEPPARFILYFPADGDTGISDTTTFVWESTFDYDPLDTILFTLLYSTDSTFTDSTTVITNLSDTIYTVPENSLLSRGTRYYWAVQAIDSDSLITWGDVNGDTILTFIIEGQVGIEGRSVTSIPENYNLSQNYPNPFNPVTEIKYALPKDCWVRLDIFNVSGQRVASLVDGNQKAGYKVARWDASVFSSGIYFYRVKAGDFVKTRKMILLK